MTRVAILGSTGSIGCQTLDVIRAHPNRFQIVGLSAWSNTELLAAQIREFHPTYVSTSDPPGLKSLLGAETPIIASLDEIACAPEAEIVLSAVVGKQGLQPAIAALRHGKTVALANKEAMIMAGRLLRQAAAEGGGELRPVDSEHSAIWQCLAGEDAASVKRLVLTASGGALRDLPLDSLSEMTAEKALAHPTWKMGRKITIDSATLFNKGLEVIEAHLLFDIPYERIDVLMHRESIVHSMVEMVDGSFKAQLSWPDMRQPIQYALSYPERLTSNCRRWTSPRWASCTSASWTWSATRASRSRWKRARAAGRTRRRWQRQTKRRCLRSWQGRIGYLDIARIAHGALEAHAPGDETDIEAILEADAWARRFAVQWITEH